MIITQKKFACLICGNPIEPSNKLCVTCQNELDFKNTLTCSCEEDNCMLICRDCIMNSDKKEKWKAIQQYSEIPA